MALNTRVAIITALLLAACGHPAEDDPAQRLVTYCDKHGIPDDVCPLAQTKESLDCKAGPWHYTMRRIGWAVTIDCAAKGDYADAQLAGAQRRWIQTAVSSQTVLNLAEDFSEWPAAECLLEPLVYSERSPEQANPDSAQPNVSLFAHDGVASIASNDPAAAAAFMFAASDCTRVGPMPKEM